MLIPNAASAWKFTSVQANAALAVLGALTAALPAVQALFTGPYGIAIFGGIVAVVAFGSIFLRVWKQNIAETPEVRAELIARAENTPVVKEETPK